MHPDDRGEVATVKVLYFHQHFSTPSGSAGTRSYEMARRLVARGHKVIMVCGSYGGGSTGLDQPFVGGRRRGLVDGIDVIEFEIRYANTQGLVRRTMSFLKFAVRSVWLSLTESYEIVFATTTPLTAGIPGIMARWLRGKPFVFEVRDLWPELPRAMGVIRSPFLLWAMGVLEWASYHSAHRLIGLSPGIVEGIAHRGIPVDRIRMVPNGCDLDIFASTVPPWRPAGIQPTDLMAVFAGTHGPANGLEAVLDAAAVLKLRRRDDVKILLIGDGKFKGALQGRALKEGLDNVVFHDPVSKIRLAGLMAATDVGLQILANVPAFYRGTSPNKFFDYIAAGVPVVNNYPGWLAELIDEAGCGFAVPPERPHDLADALIAAADDPERLEIMGTRALKLAQTRFSRAQLSDEWMAWVLGAHGE
jgi:glycosyltransferase involved in cell wall biosynthesis